MRLLIVNYEYPPIGGGASNASGFLARTLVQQGHRVSVLTSAFGKHRGLSVEEGVSVHRIPAGRNSIDRSNVAQMLRFAVAGLARASSILRSERPDGVIAFFTLPSGLIGYWLKARYDVPYVISLRGGDVPGLVPELRRMHRQVRWLRRRVLSSARAIIANSPKLAELSAKTDPFPVAVISNGVDSVFFRPPKRAIEQEGLSVDRSRNPDDFLQILFVGRLRKQKNLGLLLDQLACLRRDGVTAFRLHVVGDGPLGALMRERAARLGLEECIVWHGWVAKPELVGHYQRADCFVNPSLYEGSPNTVLEAMACGLPVVASRVGGNDALVVDRETGLLFELEEPRQLGSALTALIHDRSLARRMGGMGRARAVENYSWDSVATEFIRLFDSSSGVRHAS